MQADVILNSKDSNLPRKVMSFASPDEEVQDKCLSMMVDTSYKTIPIQNSLVASCTSPFLVV